LGRRHIWGATGRRWRGLDGWVEETEVPEAEVPEAEVEGEEQQRPAGSSNNSKHVD